MNELIRHLELIQSVISRMAQVSFLIKGWTVTLAVALLAVAANTGNGWFGLLALASVCMFWGLDAYYLRQERLFRALFDRVRLGPNGSSIPLFSMNTTTCQGEVSTWFRTLWVRVLSALHGVLLAIVVIAAVTIQLSS